MSTEPHMNEFTRQIIQAQIDRFDEVLADPEWEWDAMVDAALEVREKLLELLHDSPIDFPVATAEDLLDPAEVPIRVYIACMKCRYDEGTFVGIWHPAAQAEQVTSAMVHGDSEQHPDAELRAFSIEGRAFVRPLTLSEAAAQDPLTPCDEIMVIPPIDPKISIACLECYEQGRWVGDQYRASNAEEVTPEMIHLWPTEHTELRVFSIDGRKLAEPITPAEVMKPMYP